MHFDTYAVSVHTHAHAHAESREVRERGRDAGVGSTELSSSVVGRDVEG